MFQARLECFYFGISPGFLLSMATHHINLQISVLGNRSAGVQTCLRGCLSLGSPPPHRHLAWDGG